MCCREAKIQSVANRLSRTGHADLAKKIEKISAASDSVEKLYDLLAKMSSMERLLKEVAKAERTGRPRNGQNIQEIRNFASNLLEALTDLE